MENFIDDIRSIDFENLVSVENETLSKVLVKSSVNTSSVMEGGLYRPHINHFLSLKFISTYIDSMDLHSSLILNLIDMIFIAESKLDDTFRNSEFNVENYHLWRADRNANHTITQLKIRMQRKTKVIHRHKSSTI
jgi:hypothetical protein